LFNDKKDNSIEMFSRGYFSFPTSIIPATKEYSTAAYLLTAYLITENGNPKLQTKDHKVIAFQVGRFISVMNIKANRPSKRKAEFIRALAEVEIIAEMSPSLSDLSNTNPQQLENTVLHIKVKHKIKELDSFIKGNLLGAKGG
jgi:hypothetical protein